MKVRTTMRDFAIWLHIFLYGKGGTGKTKAAGDFHKAKQDIVLVTNQIGEMTLDIMGIKAPILEPESEAELRAIIEMPSVVIEKVIHKMDGFSSYQPKTFMFDDIRGLQLMVMGTPARQEQKIFGGVLELKKESPTGIMSLPFTRDHKSDGEVPCNLDYRVLDTRMRSIIKHVEKMPFHTIMTAHDEVDFTKETKLKLTGDPKKDKEIQKTIVGYPSMEGFSLKKEMAYLVSDFFIWLDGDGSNYTMYPKPSKGFYARTRIANLMPAVGIDWEDKNMYELIWNKYQQAKGKK